MSSLEKVGLEPKDLEGFDEETLDQLNMENIEGGIIVPEYPWGPNKNCSCGPPKP